MQMNRLIEKSLTGPELCLLSPQFRQEKEMVNELLSATKYVLVFFLHLYRTSSRKSISNVLHFNGIASVLKSFHKSRLCGTKANGIADQS